MLKMDQINRWLANDFVASDCVMEEASVTSGHNGLIPPNAKYNNIDVPVERSDVNGSASVGRKASRNFINHSTGPDQFPTYPNDLESPFDKSASSSIYQDANDERTNQTSSAKQQISLPSKRGKISFRC